MVFIRLTLYPVYFEYSLTQFKISQIFNHEALCWARSYLLSGPIWSQWKWRQSVLPTIIELAALDKPTYQAPKFFS